MNDLAKRLQEADAGDGEIDWEVVAGAIKAAIAEIVAEAIEAHVAAVRDDPSTSAQDAPGSG